MSKVLVIGAGWEQYSLIKTIKDAGHEIIATHPALNAEGFNLSDFFYVKDPRNIASHLSIAEAHKIEAVITDNCDYSLYCAAIVASKYKLAGPRLHSAVLSNHKFLQREACKQSTRQPEYYLVRELDHLVQAVKAIGFPCILKPVDSRGTFGVTIIAEDAMVEPAFYDAIQESPSRQLICETFIHGRLMTVDGFCFSNGHRALAVASRQFEEGPHPVTKEIVYPAQVQDGEIQALMANHEAVVKALGFVQGHTHGEYMLTPEGEIYLVECTNRGGGVYTSSVIVPMLTEIDLNQVLLDQSLGRDEYQVADKQNYMTSSAILAFLDFEVGRVIKSVNFDSLRDEPYVIRFRSIFGKKDLVESIENCASRHSMLVIAGTDADQSFKNFAAFKSSLSVEYYEAL